MMSEAYQSQTVPQEPVLLRGYDPLKECVQWNTLAGCLGGLLIVVSLLASPSFMNGTLPAGAVWTSLTIFLFAGLFLIAGAGPVLPIRIRAQREERLRNALRQSALQGEIHDLALPHVGSSARALGLPLRLESRLSRAFLFLFGAWVLFVCVLFLFGYLWIAGSLGAIAPDLTFAFSLLTPFMTMLGLGAINLVQISVAAHYFHPDLQIDEEGLTARYGRDTITIAWHDVRSFALLNSKLTYAGFKRKAPAQEAFEISDGENRICWLAHQTLSSSRQLLCDETRLSDQDYEAFTTQLATLIVARTALPLLDFRLVEKPGKEKGQQS